LIDVWKRLDGSIVIRKDIDNLKNLENVINSVSPLSFSDAQKTTPVVPHL
jgi:hypothetical protein